MKYLTRLILWFFGTSFLFGQEVTLVVLGTAQDAGSPQIACEKECCKRLWETGQKERVVSLGLIDSNSEEHFLFEATPDITQQLQHLKSAGGNSSNLGGIFLTHAHMGHYSGLMYLGKEALGGQNIRVYALPKMTHFLQNNGPWNQLVSEKNIAIQPLKAATHFPLTSKIAIKPFIVPHRDEYSETVGYQLIGPHKKVLFIPDIDKWEKWETPLEQIISEVDYAFIDATFYDGSELPNRDMRQIPHPFVVESMKRLEQLPLIEKKKVYFIHFNHTNPLLKENSKATKEVIGKGFNIARTNLKLAL